MECKKKKLDCDFPASGLLDFKPEEIEQLFGKKFTYCKNDSWTLGNTPFCKNELITDPTFSSQPQAKSEISRRQTQEHGSGHSISHSHEDQVSKCEREELSKPTAVEGASEHSSSPEAACNPPSVHDSCASSRGSVHGQCGFVLPESWQCDVLLKLKEELNALKDQLSDKEMVSWHQHTSSTNIAGKVVGEMKRKYRAELCTQAWCKFHEILATCDVLPQSLWHRPPTDFYSVHLCEAPGAFVTSLNHYLISRGYMGEWSWLGTTLNPYYEGNDTGQMIDDDRIIRMTYDKWCFGRDNSGDLMSVENLESLLERLRTTDVHLVTADGSIDCQENPAEQEIIVSRLHHCEVLTACLILAPGGAFVIKLFTMFEASTITLMYFLNCVFSQVTVCKPATSKSGNSEVYVVCTGYSAPLPRDLLMAVFSAVVASEQPDIVLLERQAVPDSFLTEHIKCCHYFCELQSQTISQNIELYGKIGRDERWQLSRRQDFCVEHYVKVCGMEQIDRQHRVAPFVAKNHSRFSAARTKFHRPFSMQNPMDVFNTKPTDSSGGTWTLQPGRFQGTFRDRQRQNSLKWPQVLARIPDCHVEDSGCLTIQCRQGLIDTDCRRWVPSMGKPLQAVSSSQFCDARLLAAVKQLSQNAQLRHHQQEAAADYARSVMINASELLLRQHVGGNYGNSSLMSEMYHVAFEGSVTSSCQPDMTELLGKAGQSLKPLDSLKKLGDCHDPVGVVIDVTCPQWAELEEIQCQRRLMDVVLDVGSYAPRGSSIVILVPVALTRLSAGLVYILAGLFRQTSSSNRGDSVFLHQLFHFQDHRVPPFQLLCWLEGLRCTMNATHPSHGFRTKHASVDAEESVDVTEGSEKKGLNIAGESHQDVRRLKCAKDVSAHAEESGDVTEGLDKKGMNTAGECSHRVQSTERMSLDCEESGDVTEGLEKKGMTAASEGACDKQKAALRKGKSEVEESESGTASETLSQASSSSCEMRHTGPARDGLRMSVDGDDEESNGKDADSSVMCLSGYRASSTNSDKCMAVDMDKSACTEGTISGEGANQMDDDLVASLGCGSTLNADEHHSNDGRDVGSHGDAPSAHSASSEVSSNSSSRHVDSISPDEVTVKSQVAETSTDFVDPAEAKDNGGAETACSSGKRIAASSDQDFTERTKRDDDAELLGADCGNGGSGSSQHHGGGGGGAGADGGRRSVERKACARVLLEIVPVLEILDDMTFTRFLQASNTNCMGSFINTIKAAEQALFRMSDTE